MSQHVMNKLLEGRGRKWFLNEGQAAEQFVILRQPALRLTRLEPGATVSVDRKLVESMKPSKVSMMPSGLMDTFKEDEVLDLMAYVLSRGDRNNAMFKK